MGYLFPDVFYEKTLMRLNPFEIWDVGSREVLFAKCWTEMEIQYNFMEGIQIKFNMKEIFSLHVK